MSRHAENLHTGFSMLGASLASTIVANQQARRVAAIEAQAEANAVASVRALRNELAASLAREAAMQREITQLRFELGRARGALRRSARPDH